MDTPLLAGSAVVLLGLVAFLGFIGYVVIKYANVGPKDSFRLVVASLILILGFMCLVIPLVTMVSPFVYDIVVVHGPLANYVVREVRNMQDSLGGTFSPPLVVAAATSTETDRPHHQYATSTPLPPAPTAAVFSDVLVTFVCTPVRMASGVTSVTLYQWSPDGTTTFKASDGLAVAGWTTTGWLLGCPSEKGLYLSPNEVDWQAAGISFPQQLRPTATPIPTATPTANPVVLCQLAYGTWLELGGLAGTKGTNLVPAGYTATITGPGIGRLLPAFLESWTLNVPGLLDRRLAIRRDQGMAIPGANPGGEVTFVGTGTQCN